MDRIESIEDLRACLSMAEAFRAGHGRPFITVSYAQSVDGSIAAGDRLPIQLSGPEAAVLTHQIRAASDAILIGIGTLLADDPQLTVRLSEGSNPQPIKQRIAGLSRIYSLVPIRLNCVLDACRFYPHTFR